MKLITLLLLALAWPAMANPWTVRQDTSSVNLPATFPGTPQLTGPRGIDAVQMDNSTANEVEINCSRTSTQAPGTNSVDSFYVAGNSTWSSPDGAGLGNACYWRTVSGTTSSGVIRVTVWGH